MGTVYDFTVKDREGNEKSLKDYEGKVLLIVNTATGCGFTPHYDPLEAMYKELKEKGFEILDFPCNQFAGQAPDSDEKINEFCTMKFGTEFPRFAKIEVNGENAYIKWNFTKFLINRKGEVVARFEPTVDMEEVKRAVEAEL